MKTYQYLFYVFVSFSLIIHNVTIIPTLTPLLKFIFSIIIIFFAIIIIMAGIDYTEYEMKNLKNDKSS